MTVAEVRLWGQTIAAVSVDGPGGVAAFEYTPEFLRSGIEIAPLQMPLASKVYTFPDLPRATFYGLPGLLADALPDRFGSSVINQWLVAEGRVPHGVDAVERLRYTGPRGMGALEFHPAAGPRVMESTPVNIDALVELAAEVLRGRGGPAACDIRSRGGCLCEILRVGASAGGAGAKAVIAWNRQTNEVRSGQVTAPPGFEYWLLKFDGVRVDRSRGVAERQGYGAFEYAHSLMARAAGIEMTECRLFEENGRRHFMTKRFDRLDGGEKLHMQSLGALGHFDFNSAGAHSYEQAIAVMHRLHLPMRDIEELFRRMVFNIVARNQDDHVKNITFLMDKAGRWSLAPAFDVMFSYNPAGVWTSRHQMSVNGKQDGFVREDFRALERTALMKRGRADAILDEVIAAVSRWREFADQAKVDPLLVDEAARHHRLDIV